jgi:lysophospholipase L1-like esterase/predicted esterase
MDQKKIPGKLMALLIILTVFVSLCLPTAGAVALKVACIGDSITYGAGLSNPGTDSFPAVLGRLLGANYVVNNYGISGRTLLKKGDYPYWNEQAYTDSSNWLPDIVIIMLGTNDSKSQNWQYQSEFVANYDEMINHYKNLSSHPTVYVNTCPTVYNTGLAGITNPVVRDQVNPKVRQAASDTGCTVVDVYTATNGMPQNFPDNVHPNVDGSKVLADAVYNGMTAPSTISSFLIKTYTDSSKYSHSMPYRLFVPANYNAQQTYPLVIFFHGAGERGTDNTAQLTANQGATVWVEPYYQANHPCFVIAPQCPASEQWVDTPWGNGSYNLDNVPISDEMQMALDIITQTRVDYNIDSTRIYSAGLSMGGYGTWNVNLLNSQLFAAAIPICGAGDPNKASRLTAKPIWAFHGDADPTVPVAGSRDMINALRTAGGNPKYTEFPGVGHDCWVQAFTDPYLIDWAFAQQGKPNVALNKTATAISYLTGEEPAKAVDGAKNSKWCSNTTGDKWLQVDLGKTYTMNRWVVKHAGAGGEATTTNTRDFKLQKSSDGSTWTDVDPVTGNTSSITDRGVTPFSARYVRLYITQAEQSGNVAARIYEFEVYGDTGSGTGLKGEYYDNMDLTTLKVTRTDATVNFDWTTGSPDASIGVDTFSARWTGQVQPRYSETYTFYTTSDDGVRLWVNGTQLVNNWTDHGPTENSGTISLTAGLKYDIKMEYYENTGGAAAKLSWSSSSQAKEIIPQSQLYPVTSTQVNLSSYYNQDGFSYDTNRANGAYDAPASPSSCYSADLLNSNPAYDATIYTLGPKTDGSNNEIKGTGQTITLTQGQYSSIRFLGSATSGNKTGTFRINYTDSTYTDTSVTEIDWCSSNTTGQKIVQTMNHRHNGTADQTANTYVFAYYLTPTAGKTVASLTLPNDVNIHVLAITLLP